MNFYWRFQMASQSASVAIGQPRSPSRFTTRRPNSNRRLLVARELPLAHRSGLRTEDDGDEILALSLLAFWSTRWLRLSINFRRTKAKELGRRR